jgi:hypothetical protein
LPVNPDFSHLLAAVNATDAKYLLVGGYMIVLHAHPLFTGDREIWTEPLKGRVPLGFEAYRRWLRGR